MAKRRIKTAAAPAVPAQEIWKWVSALKIDPKEVAKSFLGTPTFKEKWIDGAIKSSDVNRIKRLRKAIEKSDPYNLAKTKSVEYLAKEFTSGPSNPVSGFVDALSFQNVRRAYERKKKLSKILADRQALNTFGDAFKLSKYAPEFATSVEHQTTATAGSAAKTLAKALEHETDMLGKYLSDQGAGNVRNEVARSIGAWGTLGAGAYIGKKTWDAKKKPDYIPADPNAFAADFTLGNSSGFSY